MNPHTSSVISAILELIVLILTVAVIPMIHARMRAGKTRDAVETIALLAKNVVAETATRVRDLKDPNKPGTWDQETAKVVLAEAISAVRSQGRPAYEMLIDQMGSNTKVDELVKTAVEAEVERAKKGQ